jgi:hypothetical protein
VVHWFGLGKLVWQTRIQDSNATAGRRASFLKEHKKGATELPLWCSKSTKIGLGYPQNNGPPRRETRPSRVLMLKLPL